MCTGDVALQERYLPLAPNDDELIATMKRGAYLINTTRSRIAA
jgi:hypothetical protein